MAKYKTVKEMASLWKDYKKPLVKKSSFNVYNYWLDKHIVPHFGKMRLVSEEDVQEFVFAKLDEGMSAKSVKDIVVVLKMVLIYASRRGWTDYKTWEIRFPTNEGMIEKEKERAVMSVKEQRKLLIYLRRNPSCRDLGIYICMITGLRIGEICGLKWSDFNWKHSYIRVQRTVERIYHYQTRRTEVLISPPKTESSHRVIPINADLRQIAITMKKKSKDYYYVLSNSERPLEPRTYREHFYRVIRKLRIQKIKFHGLRHSFATRCIESNCDYKTVSTLLGHASVSTTMDMYVHPNMEHKKNCIQKMAKKLI